jgi:soluble lytic murein transglycosylase-like protein
MAINIGNVAPQARLTPVGGQRAEAPNPRVLPAVIDPAPGLARTAEGIGNIALNLAARQQEKDQLIAEKAARDFADKQKFDALTGLEKLSTEFALYGEESKKQLPADANGYTQMQIEYARKRGEEFLTTVPPDLQDEFRYRLTALQGQVHTSAFEFQQKAQTATALRQVDDLGKDYAAAAYINPDMQEALYVRAAERIDSLPGVDQAQREVMKGAIKESLATAAVGGMLVATGRAKTMVPFSDDVPNILVPAIIQIESRGDPNAVSNQEAYGLMQIRHQKSAVRALGGKGSTADGIAAALNDPNWPATYDEQIAYLKRADVSQRYGTYLLRDLLRQYGGDVELAAVAYHGGSGPGSNAEKFRVNRDPSVMGLNGQDYIRKVRKSLGLYSREKVLALSSYAGIAVTGPAAERLQQGIESATEKADRDIVAQRTAEMQQAEKERIARKEALSLSVTAGPGGMEDINRAVELGIIQSGPEYDALVSAYEKRNKLLVDTQEAVAAVMRGDPVSPYQADLAIGSANRQALAARDPNAVLTVTESVRKIGSLPPETRQVVTNLLTANDVKSVMYAENLLTQIGVNTPAVLETLSDEEKVRYSMAKLARSGGVPEAQFTDYVVNSSKVEYRAAIKAGQQTQEYRDNSVFSTKEFVDADGRSWLSDPAVPISTEINASLAGRYRTLYQMFYASTGGDAASAKSMTYDLLRKSYAEVPDGPVNQGALMYLPPQLTYNSIPFTSEGPGGPITRRATLTPDVIQRWIDRTAREALGIGPTDFYKLDIDVETERDLRAGRAPRYRVIQTDRDENPILGANLTKPRAIIALDFVKQSQLDAQMADEERQRTNRVVDEQRQRIDAFSNPITIPQVQ